MRFRPAAFFLLPFALLVACTSTTSSSAPGPSVPPDGTDAGVAEASDPSAAACADLADAVRPAIEASRTKAKTTDVAVGLITRDCPFVPIVAGPSEIPTDARFRIGSITKTFTSAVVLHFVAQGAVGLDDAIARFELGIPNDAQITVRQLLNHTSGLFNYTEDPEFLNHDEWTPQERLQVATAHDPYFAPGKSWHYSNTNFIALGMIAEKLGKAPIQSLIRSLVLEPNTLGSTYFDGAEDATGTLAPSFERSGVPTPSNARGSKAWADGALVASLDDVTHWVRKYASGDATPTLKKDLFTSVPAPDQSSRYGLALMVLSAELSDGNGASYGHGGDIPGFHSLSFYFPEREWTITAIVNSDTGDPNAVMLAAMDALAAAKK